MKLGIGQKRLWVFDFDGSVSRQTIDRNDARLHARCETMVRFLVSGPWNRVAVISSRSLDDLIARIPLPKVLLGGCSGLERMRLLQRLRNRVGIKIHRGHEAVEIQMVPGGSKSVGLRRLCRMIGWNPSLGEIVYAGGDEIDATAMKWVLHKGGSVYVVGDRITVPTARYVEGPAELASEVYDYSKIAAKNGSSDMGVEASG